MPKQPPVSAKELIKALQKIGFIKHGQRGSHIKLKHPDGRIAIVPNHKEIKRGTFYNGILKPLGIRPEDLDDLLKK